ncbi:hypothetical protein FHW67_000712 [Herbaspirillum sp. Sphag1AN]|uniref:hypothetical protein n=1 Tax=unclassified Herbaspirillum TaxID=2624150 RepID=UPI00160E41ED|nr:MULTISPECIES: hypothetical protein [unclassified Herbaspirillum]MBB3211464.1 hypothetical protein [Herbaspirillum sp. Sphag1AN]MBB3245269.1 hypothetical protein [Herbaspirillum sp. Sphag64]
MNYTDSNASTAHDEQQQYCDPTHQDFHWIEGSHQGSLYGNLLETTLDVSAGIHACLQLFYTRQLEHEANQDADADNIVAPAIGVVHADQLMRLAIASAGLLRDEARRQVEVLNQEEEGEEVEEEVTPAAEAAL